MVISALTLSACSGGSDGGNDAANESRFRYLALGDSYTIGEGVGVRERFPSQLKALLETRGERMDTPIVIAKTGWTVKEMMAGIGEANPQGPFDLVTLLIGVNDQYRGYPASGYEKDFAAALDRAIDFGGGDPTNVVVVSIPDWGVSPFAEGRDRAKVARELDEYNQIAETIAGARGAAWVDITTFSRSATERSMFAADGLHPSGMAYGEWARLILSNARAALD